MVLKQKYWFMDWLPRTVFLVLLYIMTLINWKVGLAAVIFWGILTLMEANKKQKVWDEENG
jgi:hypothetical protein